MDELKSQLRRAQNGDLDAFAGIIRRFQDMAYGCAYAMLGDFHLAQDAAQEAFIQAYRDIGSLRDAAAFPGWFRRIVIKHCDRMTRAKSVRTVPLEAAAHIGAPESDPSLIAEHAAMKNRVLDAIGALPESMRMVTTLYYINGYSQNEIAEFLEVPLTTVNNRLHASRKRLRERMLSMVDETLKSFPLGDDFADIVVRRVASDEDLKSATEYLGTGYHGRKKPEMFESIDAARGENIYVVEEGGRVKSAGYYDEITWSIGAAVMKAVRPREMAGEAAVPGQQDFEDFTKGYRGCFKMAKEKGRTLSVVHGSMYDHALCGFVPSFYYAVATLPCEVAKSVTTGAIIREPRDKAEEQAGEDALWLDAYATKMSAFLGGDQLRIVERNGAVEGCFRLDPEAHMPARKYGMPFGHITKITLRTREAALAVIKLAGELSEKAGDDEICILESHETIITQAILSLGGKYLMRASCDLQGLDAEMVAIIDIERLTMDLEGEFQRRLDSSNAYNLDSRFSIGMDGATIGFSAKSGRIRISSKKHKVHRVLPRWVVTRLYMGYYSGDDVLEMGPIAFDRSDGKTPDNPELDMREFSLPDNEAALFKALFPKLWPCSMPDPDVWPWVVGREHPKYQGEEKKTDEMKATIDALRFPWINYGDR